MRSVLKSHLAFVLTSFLAAACGDPESSDSDSEPGVRESEVTVDSSATYTIVAAQSNKCVEVAGGSTVKGASLQIAACNGASHQQ